MDIPNLENCLEKINAEDTLPTAFERLDKFASKDLGSYISSLYDVVNETSVHRINAAKEIVRQLTSPSRLLLAAKKDAWLEVNEETKNSIVAKMLHAMGQVSDITDDNDYIGALAKATVAVLVINGVTLDTVNGIILEAEKRSCRVFNTVAIMVVADVMDDIDRSMLNRLVNIFEATLKLDSLERVDKGEYQRVSTLCAFKKLIHLLNTDPSVNPNDWNNTILNNIVTVILDADGIRKGTDKVHLAAVDLLTAIIAKQSNDRTHFDRNRLFWDGLISRGKLTLLDIMSHNAIPLQEAAVDKFNKKLDEVFFEE